MALSLAHSARKIPSLCCILVFCLTSDSLLAQDAKPGPERWEPQIRAFEEQDRKQPPPREGVLFVGSSSIRLWDLAESFPELPVINRGFGGSQMIDSVHYAQRIVIKHRPKVVVVYAGDNDLSAGKSPETVLADYRAFVKKVHAELPETRIVYIAVKPSIRRWKLIETIRQTNRLIQAAAEQDQRLAFVDIDRPMIGGDGQPRPELFQKDGLHLNAEGYKLWTALVLPHLKSPAN